MSIPVNFNNKQIIEPGVYARIASGEPIRPSTFPFGGIVIIDTGNFSGYGGGSGIDGELKQGKNSIYTFENPNDFKSFVKGGEMYLFSNLLFNPARGASGPTQVSLVRACSTTCAKIEKSFTNGSFVVKAKNEGRIGNGILDEVSAIANFSLNATDLAVDADVTLKVLSGSDELLVISYTVESTSQLVNHSKVVELINSSASGFTAKMVGSQVQIKCKEGFGSNGNSLTIDSSDGEVDFSGTPSAVESISFSGGENGENLLKGYAIKVKKGIFDTNKFIVEFYLGTFKGKTVSGFNYGETDETNSRPIMVASTDEISTVDELIFWALNDFSFSKSFVLDEQNSVGSGDVQEADLSSGLEVFVDGSEDYTSTNLDLALEHLREFQNTFFICDRFGKEAKSIQNQKILDSVVNDSSFERFLIIGGGKDKTEFEEDPNSSIEVAKFYDSKSVILVHSGATLVDPITNREERFGSILTAFNVAGRLGGLSPQEPLTFKNLGIKSFLHIPSVSERTRALKSGVLHVREVDAMGVVVNQGINTLQKNTKLWNPDGTSYEISIMSIASQLNKELILNLRPLFVGASRGRVTEADVKANMEAYLLSRTSVETSDNLIIKFKNVIVRRVEDRYECSYSFEPNGPINKLLITGFMLDTNI